jgi:cell division protein FtsA
MNYICALDIGSSKIAAVVVKIQGKHIVDVFLESSSLKGMEKGVIIDSIDLINTLGRILKNLRNKSGINIKSVYTNICGQDIITKHSHALIPLAERGNKVITASDIHKVNEQARVLGSSLEDEIIHQIPFSYSIDSMNGIINPIGLYSHRLEVDLFLVCGKLSSIQGLTRVINQAGYEIKDLFLCGIATSRIVFSEDNKEGMNILCDIGSDITEIVVFKDGVLRNIEILSLGGDDLTEELAKVLKIPLDLAEDVKRSYGMIGDYSQLKKDKEILVKKNDVYKTIKQGIVSDIVNSKSNLICQAIKEKVESIIHYSEVNNFMACGRTILLEGFLEKLENALDMPVKVARISYSGKARSLSQKETLSGRYMQDLINLINKDSSFSGRKYINYISCLGIICQAMYNSQSQLVSFKQTNHNPIFGILNKFKEIYQEYF